jgi:hypothetical protein
MKVRQSHTEKEGAWLRQVVTPYPKSNSSGFAGDQKN